MRLIDADAAIYDLNIQARAHGASMRIMMMANYINQCPTIDAVPVVKCKDCKYYKVEGGQCPADNTGDRYYSWEPDRDWFCADGERVSE